MSSYTLWAKEVNRPENVIGWYHSHPGYGCWLSGIDVDTQMQNQQYQDPFVAIVVRIMKFSRNKKQLNLFRLIQHERYPLVRLILVRFVPFQKGIKLKAKPLNITLYH